MRCCFVGCCCDDGSGDCNDDGSGDDVGGGLCC